MKKIDNKLIILSTVVVLFSVTAVAQIRTFNSPNNGNAGASSAFIDASSSIGANSSALLGKGILFPQTDLTIFSNFLSAGSVGLPNNYRNYSKDGMLSNCCSCHAEIAATRSAFKRSKVVHR